MTHITVMSIVINSNGSEMPSTPMWYRLLMTSIHDLFTSNCRTPVRS